MGWAGFGWVGQGCVELGVVGQGRMGGVPRGGEWRKGGLGQHAHLAGEMGKGRAQGQWLCRPGLGRVVPAGSSQVRLGWAGPSLTGATELTVIFSFPPAEFFKVDLHHHIPAASALREPFHCSLKEKQHHRLWRTKRAEMKVCPACGITSLLPRCTWGQIRRALIRVSAFACGGKWRS